MESWSPLWDGHFPQFRRPHLGCDVCLLSALSLTARFERIYSRSRFSSAARRWKAKGARSFVKGASMSFCKCFALISTVILTALVALAYGSPPDPTWVSGVYDNADYDDVVGLVTDGAGANDNQALPRVEEGRARYVLLAEWAPAPNLVGPRPNSRPEDRQSTRKTRLRMSPRSLH